MALTSGFQTVGVEHVSMLSSFDEIKKVKKQTFIESSGFRPWSLVHDFLYLHCPIYRNIFIMKTIRPLLVFQMCSDKEIETVTVKYER